MAKLVRAMIREDKVDAVVTALERAGVDGVTVTMAQGRGQHTPLGSFRGHTYRALLPIAVVDVFTTCECAEEVARIVLDCAHTGHHGDGHVLILDVDQCISVRTRWLVVAHT